MEGGRFIASGAYGCIFTPPLLCQNGLKKKPNMVGKVESISEIRQELKIGNRIRRVPLAKNYFVLPDPESCVVLPKEKQKDPGVEKCLEKTEIFQEYEEDDKMMFPPQKVRQIFIPYGGDKTVYNAFLMQGKMINQIKNKINFFKLMEHLLEAGSTLLLARVCHFDLHPANLLMDKYNIPRIIDFGLSFETDNITKEILESRWKILVFGVEKNLNVGDVILNTEAPEITIMNATRENKFSLEKAIFYTVSGKPVFKTMETYLGLTRYSSYESLDKFWKTSLSAKNKDYLSLWRTYWPGFDAWSIGCMIFDIFQLFLYEKDFIEGDYKHKKEFILNALRGLLNPNPKFRLDCMEALAVLNPNNSWIERFGQKWLAARKQQRSKA